MKWSKNQNLFDQTTGSPVPLVAEHRWKKKFHPGPKLKRPELEEHWFSYWSRLREEGKAVTIALFVAEGTRFNNKHGLTGSSNLKSMRFTARRFMRRYNLTYRAKTHSGTYIDEAEMGETIADFVTGFRHLGTALGVPSCQIYNMDETAVYYDNTPSKTVAFRGSKSISIRTSSTASHRVTVFLCVSFSGVKLRPLVVFKASRNKTVHKRLTGADQGGCSPHCDYTAQENGWCDQSSMNDWVDSFAEETRAASGLKLLLLDNFSVHCTQETSSK